MQSRLELQSQNNPTDCDPRFMVILEDVRVNIQLCTLAACSDTPIGLWEGPVYAQNVDTVTSEFKKQLQVLVSSSIISCFFFYNFKSKISFPGSIYNGVNISQHLR